MTRGTSRDANGEGLPLLGQGASEHPEAAAGPLGRFTFSWVQGLLAKGAAAPLLLTDVWSVSEDDAAATVRDKLLRAAEHHGVGASKDARALWRAIREAFGWNMFLAGVCKLVGDGCGFVGPICINALIKYVEDPSSAWFAPRHFGLIVSGGLFLSTVLQTLCLHQHHHLVIREAIRVRAALTMVVYEKALRLSSQTKSTLGSGRILNLATTDANRILDLFYFVHYTWAAPLQLVIGILLLVRYLGYAALAGIGVMVVLLPVSIVLSSQAAKVSKRLLECTDSRLKFLNEVLRHIRIIKFYAWEVEMLDQIESIRNDELGHLKMMTIWNAFSQVSLQAGPILVSLCSFAVYSWVENEPLTPDAAFTSITLFSIFRLPLMMLPRIFSLTFQAHVSVSRLAEFLSVKEHRTNTPHIGSSTRLEVTSPFLGIRNASFAWNDDGNTATVQQSIPMLRNVSMSIPKGQLTLIVGAVGSGKSTLLAALLNELEPVSGVVKMPSDRVSYAAQSPFLINATIEDNIIYGGYRDSARLQQVVRSCELQSDFDLLPAGLKTELGENGVNLSGGQKQRISLARAVYPRNQSVYVFDDALSALDANVQTRIFNQCFSENPGSLLAGQTRVLATHALQFAQSAQWIIVMDKMEVVQMGTFDDLAKNRPDGLFAKMLRSYQSKPESTALPRHDIVPKKEGDEQRTRVETNILGGKLIEDEARSIGSVSLAIYWSYFKSSGLALSVGALAILVSAQLAQVATDLWLTKWTSGSIASGTEVTMYLTVYAYLSLITITLGFCGDLTSRLAGLSASRAIHHRLLRQIIRGTMQFFDSTPIGRILNRFSNDMNTIDQKLNASVVAFTTMFLSLASMLVIQCSSAPLLMLVLVPVFAVYFSVQLYYRQSCRELQRLDSVTKSPVYSNFTETLNGLVTIRAFSMVPKSSSDQAHRINENTRAFLALNLINRWLGVRLECLGALITLAVACFVSRDHFTMTSAMAGLLLSYSQNVTGLLNWIVRNNIDMENMMNSIERTDEYSSVDVEALAIDQHEVSSSSHSFQLWKRPNWPEKGEIVFSNVHLKYRPDADFVLRGITFSIAGGEKVGICGRTGAGKSSLLLSLFRLVRSHSGKIEIDGVDISQLHLPELRSRMAIIPQEPVLFAASIRFNLDPTGEHDDESLWGAVKKSHLYEFIKSLPGHLDCHVLEGGENFSQGERQLICLARAILRKSKILCLDEATASMDHSTDALIQASIRIEFAEATVLTIAHRVQTILDYDKVMVLKRGQVAEFGPPERLLTTPGSEFASMVNDH